MPFFSIIVPTYNRGDELRDAVSSCLAQTFGDLEVIVVDDCSTEDIRGICDAYKDPRLRYVRNAQNQGASASRNAGLSIASGRYVSFLDSDDVYLPSRLKSLRLAIDHHGAPGVVAHQQYRVLRSGTVDGELAIAYAVLPKQPPPSRGNLAEFIFANGDFIQTNSFIVRRDIADGGRFGKEFRVWDDVQFLLQARRAAGEIHFVTEPLSVFFDESPAGRISQNRTLDQHSAFLEYLVNEESSRAVALFRALAVSDAVFYSHPLQSAFDIIQGWRAGTPWFRSAFYLVRSVVGFSAAKTLVATLGWRRATRLSQLPSGLREACWTKYRRSVQA